MNWKLPCTHMYLNVQQICYLPGEVVQYTAKIWLKDGMNDSFPFKVNRTKLPYESFLKFINVWISDVLQVKLVELYVEGEYMESYEPINGWFKRKEALENK